MGGKTVSYAPECYDLAALFLSDWPEKNTEENRDKLAQHIQTEIESEIEFILEPTEGLALSPANEDVGNAGSGS
jgi:hypothetical protein